MAEINNEILFSVGFNQAQLEKNLAQFTKTFQATLKKSLADIDLSKEFQKALGIGKGLNINVKFTAKQVQEAFTAASGKVNLKVPITLDLTKAKQQLAAFQATIQPIIVPVATGGQTTGQGNLFSGIPGVPTSASQLSPGAGGTGGTGGGAGGTGGTGGGGAAAAAIPAAAGAVKNMAFQFGILGFSIGIVGRQLQGFGIQALTFIRNIGDATRALKTMRDITEGNIITQEKLNAIRETFRSTDEALEKAFGTNKLELLQQRGLTGIEIISALSKNLNDQDRALLLSAQAWDRLDVAVKRAKGSLSAIFAPGVTALADFVEKRLIPLLDRLKARFDALPDGTKTRISELLIAIPALVTAVGTIGILVAPIFSTIAGILQIINVVTALSAPGAVGAGAAGSFLGALAALATPAGLAVIAGITALIAALVTDFGGISSSVSKGFNDMAGAAGNFLDKLTAIQNTKFGAATTNILGDIGRALSGLIGTIAESEEEVVASLLNNLAGLLNAFAANSFQEFLDRLKLSTTKAGIEAFGAVAASFDGVMKHITKLLFDAGVIGQKSFDNTNASIDESIKYWSTLSVTIEDGKLKLVNYNKEAETTTETIKSQTEALKAEKTAYEELEIAAGKAAKAASEAASTAKIAQTKEEISSIKAQISSLSDEFKKSLNNLFTQEDIDAAFDRTEAAITKLRQRLATANTSLLSQEGVKAVQSLGAGKEAEAATEALRTSASKTGTSIQGLGALVSFTGIFAGTSGQEIRRNMDTFVAAFKELAKVDEFAAKDAPIFASIIQQINSALGVDAGKARAEAIADVNTTLRAVSEAQEARKRQLNIQQTTLDEQAKIRAKQADIAQLDIQVENFLITKTDALKRRIELEKQVSELQRQAEISKTDPNNTIALADIKKRFDENLKVIDAQGKSALQKSFNDSTNLMLENAARGADLALKVYKDTLTKGIRQRLDVGGIVSDDIINGLVEGFSDIRTKGLQAHLNKSLADLRNELQPILLSSGQFGTVTTANLPILQLLGLTDEQLKIGAPIIKEQLIKAVQSVKDVKSLRGISDILGGSFIGDINENAGAEFQTFLGDLDKALGLLTEIGGVTSAAKVEIGELFLKLQTEILNEKLDTQISDIQARISKATLDQNAKLITELTAQQEILEFKKQDLALITAEKEAEIRLKAEDATDAEILLLQKKLAADRIALAEETNNKIKGTTGVNPGVTPANNGNVDIKVSGIQKLRDAAKAGDEFRQSIENLNQLAQDGVLNNFSRSLELATDNIKNNFDILTETVTLGGNIAQAAFVGFFDALGDALIKFLETGDNILSSLGEFFGSLLIMLGEQLIKMAITAVAFAAITAFFEAGGGFVGLAAAAAAAAAAAPMAAIGIAAGALLILAGQALGGKGSYSADNTVKGASTNSANSQTGASGNDNFDPNKDPRTIYQKALMASIMIEVRTDDAAIVNTVIKEVNANGRLTTLIGNKRLGFEL